MFYEEKLIVLITGANGGLGFATAKELLCSSSDYHIIIGSRKGYNGVEAANRLAALPNIKGSVSSVQLDVTDDVSIALAAEEVAKRFGRLDVLLNNAGICLLEPDTVLNLRKTLATNVVGAIAVTEAFKPLLKRSAIAPRIVFVSSSMGSIAHAADPMSQYFRSRGGLEVSEYRVSKAALNMAMVQVWKKYPSEEGLGNVKVLGVDPGPNRTNLLGPKIMTSEAAKHLPEPHVGAALMASVVKGEHDDKLGKIIGKSGVNAW